MARYWHWTIPLALLTGCSDSELVGVHVALGKDGSGTLTVRSLQATNVAGPAESRTTGVEWNARASVTSSQGKFHDLSGVELGNREVRFLPADGDQPRLRVLLERKKDLAWVKAMAPDEATRRSLAKVHDPTSPRKEIADTIRFEIQTPADIVASDVAPAGRGIEAMKERNRATLVLPVQEMLTDGEALIWDITWR